MGKQETILLLFCLNDLVGFPELLNHVTEIEPQFNYEAKRMTLNVCKI